MSSNKSERIQLNQLTSKKFLSEREQQKDLLLEVKRKKTELKKQLDSEISYQKNRK